LPATHLPVLGAGRGNHYGPRLRSCFA
jgi:hypothetical protein